MDANLRLILWAIVIAALLSIFSGCGGGSGSSPDPEEPYMDPWGGLDLYLAQNKTMPCTWKTFFDGKPRIGLTVLWLEGMRADRCIRSFLQDPRPKQINLMMGNGVCKRRGTCDLPEESEYRRRVWSVAIDAIDYIRSYAVGEIRVVLVLELEDNFRSAEAAGHCRWLRNAIGETHEYELWRNPVRASAHDFNEPCFDGVRLHNEEEFPADYAGECQWSNDGYDISEPGYPKWNLPFLYDRTRMLDQIRNREGRGCGVYLWSALYSNCLRRDSSDSGPVDRRFCGSGDRRAALNTLISIDEEA